MTVAYSTTRWAPTTPAPRSGSRPRCPQAANVTRVIDQTDLFLTLLGVSPATFPALKSRSRLATCRRAPYRRRRAPGAPGHCRSGRDEA